jgi:hypothetical protein
MLAGRMAVQYFVSLPFRGMVAPHVRNDTNAGMDMAELAMENCPRSGTPPPHLLAPE